MENYLKWIIAIEGGYVNNPQDPGGETKYGISKRAYPNLDIKALTVEDANTIYTRDYYLRYRCNLLQVFSGTGLDIVVFDGVVNCGAYSIKWLQLEVGVMPDTIIGPKTIAAIKQQNPSTLINNILVRRQLYYCSLPTFEEFGKGWFRRILTLKDYVIGVSATKLKTAVT